MSIEHRLLDEANRREQAHLGGGERRVAIQHARVKYTARERLEKLGFARGKFREILA